MVLAQGTTEQDTYKAIDPLEEKRELRSIKRKHRAQRALWRHQERMERAKHGGYYNRGYYNRVHRYNRFYDNSFINPNTLLSLGLLGCYIF